MSLFPNPYPDELLYSVVARYSLRSGKTATSIVRELFDRKQINITFLLPNDISKIGSRLLMSSEDIIVNHTLFPYYTFFLTNEFRQKILDFMLTGRGNIYRLLGLIGSKVPLENTLKCCPECIKDDIKNYGEPYWHRTHQLPGVIVCGNHYRKLISSCNICGYSLLDLMKLQYHITPTHCPQGHPIEITEDDIEQKSHHHKLVNNSLFILNSKPNNLGIIKCQEKYTVLLGNVGLGARNYNSIYYKSIVEAFNQYYGDFLNCIGVEKPCYEVKGWLNATLKHKRVSPHPLYHLLIIGFMCDSVSSFLQSNKVNPFGEGPWKCFNKVCDHYEEEVIKNVQLDNLRREIGIFSCYKCGFTYLCNSKSGKYRFNRVIRYGPLFKRKLAKEFSELKNLTSIQYKFGLNNKVLKKFYQIFKDTGNCESIDNENDNREFRRKKLIDYLKENPNATRNEIRKDILKHYNWLYKYDNDWLLQITPKRVTYKPPSKNRLLVNWEHRDKILSQELILRNEEYIKLYGRPLNTPETIKRVIGKSNYESNLFKMPKTENIIKTLLRH